MKYLLLVFLLKPLPFAYTNLHAQARGIVVSGKVVSCDDWSPLEGVTVQVKGTKNISGTLFDGAYAIEITRVDSILVFSYEGYLPQERKIVAGRNEYNIALKSIN